MRIRGMNVEVQLHEASSFFDDWIKHGATELGVNKEGIRYVRVDGDIYYNLDDAHKILSFHNVADDIQQYLHGISGDQIKDFRKMVGEASSEEG